MPHERNPKADSGQPAIYHIRIAGQLGRHWAGWFEGLDISLEDNGDTLISGPVAD